MLTRKQREINDQGFNSYREYAYVEILEGKGDIVKHERPAPSRELDRVDYQQLGVGTSANNVYSERMDEFHPQSRAKGVLLVCVCYFFPIRMHYEQVHLAVPFRIREETAVGSLTEDENLGYGGAS